MIKRGLIVLCFLILIVNIFYFAHAEINPESPPIDTGDKEIIENIAGESPITKEGQLDTEAVKGWKSKAELRIEELNKIVGPVSKILMGQDLTLSWKFAFALVIWLIIAGTVMSAMKNMFSMNGFLAFGSGVIVAIVSMNAMKNQFEEMMTVLYQSAAWIMYSVLGALVIGLFVAGPILSRYLHKQIEAAQKGEDERNKKIVGNYAKAIEEATSNNFADATGSMG